MTPMIVAVAKGSIFRERSLILAAVFSFFSNPAVRFRGPHFFFAALVLYFGLIPVDGLAGFGSGITLSVGEEYNDNIFFTNEKGKRSESDFITHIVPTFNFYYVPTLDNIPTFKGSISPGGQIFVKNSDLNNFGDNLSSNINVLYKATPRLLFSANEVFVRGGGTRTIGLEAFGATPQLPTTPTTINPSGTFTLPIAQDIWGLVSEGKNLSNNFTLEAAYLLARNATLYGAYNIAFNEFGSGSSSGNLFQSVTIRGAYNWRENHNLHAGYTIQFINNHDAKHGQGVIHNIDFGDDYLSLLKIQITPTLTISGTTGVSLNTSGHGPGVANTSTFTLVKLWRAAILNFTLRRGLDTTFGLSSGVAETTTAAAGFAMRPTQNLTFMVGGDYSIITSSDVDLKVFRAAAGVQYNITNWLSSHLWFGHRFRDAGNGAGNTAIASPGRVSGNSVFVGLSMNFDIWPHFGLGRGGLRALYPWYGGGPTKPFEMSPTSTPEPSAPGSTLPSTPGSSQ